MFDDLLSFIHANRVLILGVIIALAWAGVARFLMGPNA